MMERTYSLKIKYKYHSLEARLINILYNPVDIHHSYSILRNDSLANIDIMTYTNRISFSPRSGLYWNINFKRNFSYSTVLFRNPREQGDVVEEYNTAGLNSPTEHSDSSDNSDNSSVEGESSSFRQDSSDIHQTDFPS